MITLSRVFLLSSLSHWASPLQTEQNKLTEAESLPTAQAWSDQPLCPLWGPMEGFYREGVEAGRVGLIKETKMIY